MTFSELISYVDGKEPTDELNEVVRENFMAVKFGDLLSDVCNYIAGGNVTDMTMQELHDDPNFGARADMNELMEKCKPRLDAFNSFISKFEGVFN